MASTLSVLLICILLVLSSSTDYIDHISCNGSNFYLTPNDQLISLDGNTRLNMSSNGEWMLQSRTDSSSSWIKVWTTNSHSDTITSNLPDFVIQRDRNLVVYTPNGCGSCYGWQANIAAVCCATYHFFVHNGGYAYLLDAHYNYAQFTTNSSISPTADPTLYPASTLTTTNSLLRRLPCIWSRCNINIITLSLQPLQIAAISTSFIEPQFIANI